MTKVDVYVLGKRRGQVEVEDRSIIGRLLAGDPESADYNPGHPMIMVSLLYAEAAYVA